MARIIGKVGIFGVLVVLMCLRKVFTQIDYQYSSISKINSNYFKGKIVTTEKCSIRLYDLPSGWIPLKQVFYIPTFYSNPNTFDQFSVTALLLCSSQEKRLKIIVQNIEGFLTFYRPKNRPYDLGSASLAQFEEEANYSIEKLEQQVKIRQEEHLGILELFDTVMRLQRPEEYKFTVQKSISTGRFYPLYQNQKEIISLQQLPNVDQMKQFINNNDSYSISVTIQNVLNSNLNCTQKATYLQEFSGYIDYHLNRLQLNLSQAQIVISEAQKEARRLEKQIKLAENERQNLNITSLRAQFEVKMKALDLSYLEQRNQAKKIKSLQSSLSQLNNIKFPSTSQRQNASNNNVSQIRSQLLNISEKYPDFKDKISQAVAVGELAQIADQIKKTIEDLLDGEVRNNDKIIISSKQLEIDVARVMVNLETANNREKQIFRSLQDLQQQLFSTNSLVSSFRRVLSPLGAELSQISIYRTTINDQLDLIYYHCFNVTSISTVENHTRVIELSQDQFKNYIQAAYEPTNPENKTEAIPKSEEKIGKQNSSQLAEKQNVQQVKKSEQINKTIQNIPLQGKTTQNTSNNQNKSQNQTKGPTKITTPIQVPNKAQNQDQKNTQMSTNNSQTTTNTQRNTTAPLIPPQETKRNTTTPIPQETNRNTTAPLISFQYIPTPTNVIPSPSFPPTQALTQDIVGYGTRIELSFSTPNTNQIVRIIRSSLSDQYWMQKYGVFNINDSFSCIEKQADKTGSGIIKLIYKDIVAVQAEDNKLLYLKISPCTRIETVGSRLPEVGQRIYWRGEVKMSEIQTTNFATF